MGLSIGQSLGFFQPARNAPRIQRAASVPESPPRVGFSIDAEGKDDVTKWPRGTTFPAPVLIERDEGFEGEHVQTHD